MIESFEIQNFRCFERVSLSDLRTINILVGDNGSGKTALIEALLLSAHAHPRVATLIRLLVRNRPLPPQGKINWNRDTFQSLWEDLFLDFSHSKTITATFTDTLSGKFEVKVSYRLPTTAPAFGVAGSIPELVFERSGPDGKPITTTLRIDDKGNAVFEGSADPLPPVYILPSTSQFLSEDIVAFFSDLSRQNSEHSVVEAMKVDFPQISGISILTEADVPGLFVTTSSVASAKIPLALVSSGAARYLNVLLAVAQTRNGIVLVDEIENGIYWRKMPNIWKTLRRFCREQGVQLFATTHSNECLQSLVEGMQGNEDDFSLIRNVVVNGTRKVEQFYGKTFLAALEQHGEVR